MKKAPDLVPDLSELRERIRDRIDEQGWFDEEDEAYEDEELDEEDEDLDDEEDEDLDDEDALTNPAARPPRAPAS